ncbi:MAG: hypothetical protein IKV25_00575 [Clostridia bacterium]|nr:hypothetical protein [Clostridia bacterium]
MSKKIIAVALALVCIATIFTACKQKYETTDVNGQDLLLYTDENGNTVINDENQIVVVVTDEDGEIITYENGEEQTRFVQISGSFIGDGYIQGKNFKINTPKGWEGTQISRIIKKNTDNKCYITFVELRELGEKESITTHIEELDATNEQLREGFEQQGYIFTVEKKLTAISTYGARHYIYRIVDGEGKTVHYAENIFFEAEKIIYSVDYVCMDGEGYDETFNFASFVQENFKFNG